ncbi:hypothetical protein, partial [uncultured Tateyamaria sp.]|uniref:hypothetical protein n=1 Tax=uncultured Tateyamaria sp. TaxID=455651 RepID=UPI0026317C9D
MKPKFISVKGTVGIGKSTFLRYVTSICEGMEASDFTLYSLYVDPFELGDDDPTMLSIFNFFRGKIAHISATHLDASAHRIVLETASRYDEMIKKNPQETSYLIEFVSLSCRLFKNSNVRLAFVFDNLDLLPSKTGLPPLKWSSAMFRKTEDIHGKQAT